MIATSISFGLLIVLFTILLLLWMRERKSEVAGSGQRVCPNCGLITSKSSLPRVWRGQFLEAVA
jgi:hypothetical protein